MARGRVVKLTFIESASLEDPARLFNASLDGNARRSIDIHEGEAVDASAFEALVRRAVALNRSGRSKLLKRAKPQPASPSRRRPAPPSSPARGRDSAP